MFEQKSEVSGRIAPLSELKRASRWLNEFAANVTSHKGEDGIIARALAVLPVRDRWCVEFGAWDGKHLSNTYDLVSRENYHAVLIEAAKDRYEAMRVNYPYQDRAIFLQGFVGWSAKDGLDQLLSSHPIPRDFDFLCIDIDGNDYHVWKVVREYRPKMVLIEFNYTIANAVDFVPPAEANCAQGCSAAALVRLGKEKGYEVIAATHENLLFVDRAYYHLFNIPDNSLEVMRDEYPNYVYFGYDGTVFLHGRCLLEWHPGLSLDAEKVQVLPKMLRHRETEYTFVQKSVFRTFFLWTHPKEGLRRIRNYFQRRSK